MPFGIGSIPSLKIDIEKLKEEKYYLEFEEEEDKIHFLYLVDGLVGTEYARNIMADKRTINLAADMFKNDAIIMKGLKSKKVTLKEKGTENKVFSLYYAGFPYLAIWSRPNAPFISIEPWMTTPDNIKGTGVFRQKGDILIIPPMQEFECKYTVEFF